jgi:hypothetical protein
MSSGMTRPRLALAGCLVACALAAACDAGSVAGNGGGDDDFPARIPSDDPSFDARLDALGIVCESSLTITGTFAPGDPAPDGHDGCWAVGTWTVEPAMDHVGCDPQPPILPEYTYDVTHPRLQRREPAPDPRRRRDPERHRRVRLLRPRPVLGGPGGCP